MKKIMKELIRKYEIQSKTLLKIIEHKDSNEYEVNKCLVARRFVVNFLNDLKLLNEKIERL